MPQLRGHAAELFGAAVLGAAADRVTIRVAIAEGYTLLTYMFFHGDIFHLLGNMLFLWVFGDNVEDAMGHAKFLFFYLACGVFAGLFHAWMLPDSDLPLIGASGAVAGVIAAYLMLHPRVRVWVLAFQFIPLRISAGSVLGAVGRRCRSSWCADPDAGPVAWWAHIGGLHRRGRADPVHASARACRCSTRARGSPEPCRERR